MNNAAQGKISVTILVLVGLLSLTLNLSLTEKSALASSAQIGGNSNGYSCVGSESNRWKIEDGNSATLPSGYSFASVVVKAGQDCVSVYPTNTAPTCYSVNLNGNTVTVNKISSGSSCQDVSHLEGTYIIDPTPTPTPTATPTTTPTATPTPTVDPNGQGGNGTPTPTPTNTIITDDRIPTPTPTPTPTDTPSGQGGSDDEADCCPGPDDPTPAPKVAGKVAGAKTTATPTAQPEIKSFPSTGFNPLPLASLVLAAGALIVKRSSDKALT